VTTEDYEQKEVRHHQLVQRNTCRGTRIGCVRPSGAPPLRPSAELKRGSLNNPQPMRIQEVLGDIRGFSKSRRARV
jgi:hypothetical protein